MWPARLPVRVLVAIALAVLTGCAGAQDRYSPEVQRSFREHPMVRTSSERVRLYHPAERQEDAQRLLDVFDACVRTLEALLPHETQAEPFVVVMPESAFNNAYVHPGQGDRVHTVVPTLFSDGWLAEIGLHPSPGFVACHEAVHALQALQISGFPALVRRVLGPQLTPQIGLDFWFWEGLAVYHESALHPGMGRMNAPIWRQTWRSGLAHEGLRSGDMSLLQRRVPFGGHYLVGSHFVQWLVDHHGEERLWELVHLQGQQVLGLVGLNQRFHTVYGQSLERLFATFRKEMLTRWTPRDAPPEEERVLALGEWPLVHVNRQGDVAWLETRPERPPTLHVRRADGTVVLRRVLPELVPGAGMRAALPEGIVLSEDGESLWIQTTDLGGGRWIGRLLRIDLTSLRTEVTLEGPFLTEGTVDTHRNAWWAAEVVGDMARLVRIDLEGGTITTVLEPPLGIHLAQPTLSPDGAHLALLAQSAWSTELWVLSPDPPTSSVITRYAMPPGGIRHPQWEDDNTLLFAAYAGDTIQVQRLELETSRVTTLSRSAWAAVRPFPTRMGLHMAVLEGWRWHLVRLHPDREKARDHGLSWHPRLGLPTLPVPPVSSDPMPGVGSVTTERYRPTDELFHPLLRAPVLLLQGSNLLLGARAEGRDVLDTHSWQISAGAYGPSWRPFGDAAWTHRLWAPLRLTLEGGLRPEPVRVEVLDEEVDGAPPWERGWRDVFSTSLRLGLDAARASTHVEALAMRVNTPTASNSSDATRLVGGRAAASAHAQRRSAHFGTHSALGVAAQLTALATDDDRWPWLVDPRLEARTVLPLIEGGRLTLHARGVGRAVHAPEPTGLLAVGQGDLVASLWQSQNPALPEFSEFLESGPYRWTEALRGFEDDTRYANQLLLTESAIRLPVVIDRGTLTSLSVLPAFMLREFRVEVFHALLLRDADGPSWAVGGSVDMLVAIWVLPFHLRWQTAWRPSETHLPFHLFALVLEP